MTQQWTRRQVHKTLLALTGSLLFPERGRSQPLADAVFQHPGMLHGAADLARMRKAVEEKRKPVYEGFERLRDDPHSQLSYRMRGPFAVPSRNPTIHIVEFDSDAAAVYQCALMWTATGDERYAAVSRGILNAWAATLEAITGIDAILACGLGGFLYLNGAEILRSTGQSTQSERTAWRQMFLGAYLPVIAEFAPFANGNWDAAALKTVMAIGVFCDDASLFDHAVQYYLYGCGDGRLTNYIYPSGQCQESGRDQAHTQLGLGHMGDCCEIAWQQGLNLYGVDDNRLLRGFEYTAQYQLGETVSFLPNTDRTGKYSHDVISERHPKIQPIFEQVYNHYAHRMNTPAPQSERAAERMRPEGPNVADHPGFGTFTFSRDRENAIAPPAFHAAVYGLRALGSKGSVRLEWLPLYGHATYTVQRSGQIQGPYKTLAVDSPKSEWVDGNVVSGSTYFYRVTRTGEPSAALVASATAGVPTPWTPHTIGNALVAPAVHFSADSMVLEAGGRATGSNLEGGMVVTRPWSQGDTLTARLVPRIASQFLSVGLVTESPTGSKRMGLYLAPIQIGVDEHPHWFVSLRSLGDEKTVDSSPPPLEMEAPVLLYGRVMGELWFRLRHDGQAIAGLISSDGKRWKSVGSLNILGLPEYSEVGVLLNSGLGAVTTEAVLDHVILEKLPGRIKT